MIWVEVVAQKVFYYIKRGGLKKMVAKQATFEGTHNITKAKVFLFLYHRRYKLHLNTGLDIRRIAEETGTNYDYLRAKAGKWCRWKYLSRQVGLSPDRRPVYLYYLGKRGETFLRERVPKDVLQRCIRELQAVRWGGDHDVS